MKPKGPEQWDSCDGYAPDPLALCVGLEECKALCRRDPACDSLDSYKAGRCSSDALPFSALLLWYVRVDKLVSFFILDRLMVDKLDSPRNNFPTASLGYCWLLLLRLACLCRAKTSAAWEVLSAHAVQIRKV